MPVHVLRKFLHYNCALQSNNVKWPSYVSHDRFCFASLFARVRFHCIVSLNRFSDLCPVEGPRPRKWGSGQSRVVTSLREDPQAIQPVVDLRKPF